MRSVFTGRRRHSLGIALATMLTIGVIAAASASAAFPEYSPLGRNSFTLTSGEMTFEQMGGLTGIHCKKASGGFVLLNVKEFKGNIAFKECSALAAGSCASEGAAEGEIVAPNVPLRLEYLSKATHEVAIILNYNSSGEAGALTSFKCKTALTKATVRGPLVAKLTPINTLTTNYTFGLKGSGGLQELIEYEKEGGSKVTAFPEMTINGGAYKAADLNAINLEFQGSSSFRIVG
ncbi:MAG TPA: hypothetical protein VK781_08305 [Solirubrobacteraceae bacterium]|jgi:hypothetical protein|nr:hypothetical protein [Solirubrobacteraceae bacterium]